ncbi:MAG: KTSC domain-containing protein [Bacillota bacterium]|nr:KTSC domain-containing protein [Bacillota bacterium]
MNTKPKTPVIAMDAVESSQISKIGHDPKTNTIAIQFSPRKDGTPGSVYHYGNFDAAAFKAFRDAESIGSHFGKHIKSHADKHPFVKV